jgi:hypothetical protein
MASPALAQLASRYKALPKNQQMAILYGVPVALALTFSWFTWKVMADLGADPSIPPFLRREGMGKWAEISGVDDQILEKQKVIDEKPDIERHLTAIKGDISDAEQRLPREAEKAQMREVIERLAREIPQDLGSVKIKSVRIVEDAGSAEAKKNDLRTVTYQTEITGDLNGIIKYIDSVEKNTRFMMVNSISFRSGSVAVDPQNPSKLGLGQHAVKMDLVTYVYASGKGKVAK